MFQNYQKFEMYKFQIINDKELIINYISEIKSNKLEQLIFKAKDYGNNRYSR